MRARLIQQRLTRTATILIVGAGPAGLILSKLFRERGVSHFIVDRHVAAGSWTLMPPSLRLVSPWWTNILDMQALVRYPPFATVTAREYATYLRDFADRNGIEVVSRCNVSSISRDGSSEEFIAQSSLGDFAAKYVICATGYFSAPAAPAPSYDSDGSIPVVHASRYRSAAEIRKLAGNHPALIVGKRISAGQIMIELYDGGVPVCLSCRMPIEFRPGGNYGAARDGLYYFYEEALLRFRPTLNAISFPAMDGGRSQKLIERGDIRTFPPIVKILKGVVEFADGSCMRAGAVIHATGYRPALPSLGPLVKTLAEDGLPSCRGWESVDTPGLYFLGLDNRVNYRSRTLRGIRRDAVGLLAQIQHRMSHS